SLEAYRVRKLASSMAVSPPPTTAMALPRKKKPSQVAQVETPLPSSGRSSGSPSKRAEAPAAMMRVWGLVRVIASRNGEGACGKIDIRNDTGIEFRAESLRLFAHIFDQLVAQDAVGEAGVIFDHGGQRELSARLMTVDDQRLQIGTRSVDGGGEASAAAADDHHVVHFHCSYLILARARRIQLCKTVYCT